MRTRLVVKKNKIVFNIIISILTGLSLCLGWYFVYTEFLSPDIDETKVEEIEEEKEEEPEEPIIEEPKLNFDENLSFYKGLTSNEAELYQKRPYTPQEKTGVVKCENITPINQDNLLQVQNVYYIYYENYLTKKVLFVQTSTFQYQNLYNASLNSFDELEKAWEGKKGFKYIVKKSHRGTYNITTVDPYKIPYEYIKMPGCVQVYSIGAAFDTYNNALNAAKQLAKSVQIIFTK